MWDTLNSAAAAFGDFLCDWISKHDQNRIFAGMCHGDSTSMGVFMVFCLLILLGIFSLLLGPRRQY